MRHSFLESRTGAWNVCIPVETVTFTRGEDKLKSYHYLGSSRNFCPNCCIQMTSTLIDPDHEDWKIMSLNVRTFRDIDYEKIQIRYADMKNEDPQYDVDAMPDTRNVLGFSNEK